MKKIQRESLTEKQERVLVSILGMVAKNPAVKHALAEELGYDVSPSGMSEMILDQHRMRP